jgi:hypothetical protein
MSELFMNKRTQLNKDSASFNPCPNEQHKLVLVRSDCEENNSTECDSENDSNSSAQQLQEKQPDAWKNKLHTELCKFWLKGEYCQNRFSSLGCGFAHGRHELQPKSGLNEKYLTSVCKNFLDHPSKCTFGDRCFFIHPEMDLH